MNSMETHDLVQIISQPKMQPFVNLKGCIAIITNIQDDCAEITTLELSGSGEGSGVVELDCLQKIDKAVWRAARAVYLQNNFKEESEPVKSRKRKVLGKPKIISVFKKK